MEEKKLHYKMYKDGKKFVFAGIASLSFFVFGGVSTEAVHADTTSGNLTAATVNSTSDTNSAVSSAATEASSASDTKSAGQSAATEASSASDTKSAAQSAATEASSASDTKSAGQSAATEASSASDTKSAGQSAATEASSASDTKSAGQSAATEASSASDTKSAGQSAATEASSASDTKSAGQSAATEASSASDTNSAAQSAATAVSSAGDTNSAAQSAATAVSSAGDTKSAGQSAATEASSASDTKSAAQSAATAVSSASDTKSAGQSAATEASSASDTKSAAQSAATAPRSARNRRSAPSNDATSQTNRDGKTQYSSLNNAQILSFELNSQDSNAPTATGVNLTATYTQANLPQQFKNDGMTGDTFWLYSGADLLKKNVSITKHWANAGSINGRSVDFHERFHDFVAQNNPGDDGIRDITVVDKKNPYLILISSNAVDNIDVYNANFQETFWFTYSNDGSTVDITKFDQAHAAQNNNQIFYFLSASLSSNNRDTSNRREYVQTKDAKTVVISKKPINDPSTGFTAPASTMGLTSVSGTNVPDGLVYTNTDPSGYQSHDGEDSNPYYYALQGGVTFADFTSNKPTLYLGAVPISNSSAPWWWHGNRPWWWHGNHNKNSDFLSFVTYSIFNNKKVNETINYVDQTGKTVAPSHTANPITFITVKAWDGTTTYYKFGSQEDPTLDNAGKPDSSWIQADNAKFGAIDNPKVKGYKVISTTAPGSDLNSVAIQTVNSTSDDLKFTVVYAPAYSTSRVKTVTETVHYIGQDGKPVANDASGIPTSFVTITNPIDGSTATYYSKTESDQPTLDNNGVPVGDWTQGNSTDFAAIINPSVIGQHVVSTTDPGNDLTQTTVKRIDSNSDNLDFTVTYKANQEAANVTYIDDKTGKTLSAKHLTGDYGSTDPYRTGDTIADYEKQGYQLVSDNYPTHGVVYNQDGTVQSFEVHLTHGTTPVGPNNPQTPGQPINPDNPDGPKWPEGTDKSAVTQTVIRTVNYLDKQTGKVVAKQVTEQVTYNRTAIVDKVTGQIIGYSTTGGDTVDQTDGNKAWTAVDNKSDWDSVTSPDLSSKGYLAPDLAKVAQQKVTPGDKDVTVNVYYDHAVVPVNPTHPQTPGTPINPGNPDGPKWPEGTDKSAVTQTVIRTVNYLDKQTGKVVAKQVTEQVTYNRTAIVDKVTGQIIGYSTTGGDTVDQTDGNKAWTAVDNKSDWDSVTSPDLSSKGYLAPDLAKVAQQKVTPGDKDVTVNVYYDHAVVPVNPTHPQTPGTPINPDDPDSPKWPAGTDKDSLTTDVHQTIHYQYGDGSQAAPDKTDSTTFDHQVEIDKVTGEIVKDEGWTAENGKTSFDSKNSPVIPGYTASKPASDSVDGLTQDSKDDVQTIVYAKTPVAGGNVTAKYVDENGNPIADDVIASGNVGDPYSTTQKDVPGYTFKEVQGNPTGSFTDQDQTVTYVYTKNPSTDNNGGTGLNQPEKPGNGTDTGNPSSNQPGNPSQPSNATNNGVINTSTNTGSKVNNGAVNSPELPQTGENNRQSQTMSFIGVSLAMFGSLLGFLGIKKRRND